MILYFSGTGNSFHVAETLSQLLDDTLLSITDTNPEALQFDNKDIGFVFPIYSWGVAPAVIEFIAKLPESFVGSVKKTGLRVWMVCTCGDETAMAPEMFVRAIRKHGLIPGGIWSVIMPNNYVILPGFDVDEPSLADSKLSRSGDRVVAIAEKIRNRVVEIDVTRGSMPRIKTMLIYPMFKRWGIFPRKWNVSNKCISCGRCVKACPIGNVTMSELRPVWGNRCLSCLGCYGSCPVGAISYGTFTANKGSYYYPVTKKKTNKTK
jgi:ferredoxin/flavodoxin